MKRLFVLLLLAVPCFGLKSLTTSAAFTDAQGNPCVSCYIVFNLSRGANLVAGGDVVPVPPITINIGVAGILIPGQQIIGNDEMQPTGTYYIVRIFNQNNVLVRGPEKWIISGASPVDLSLMIDVTIPDPGLGSPVLQNPSQAQTITGFPLTLTPSAPLTVQAALTDSVVTGTAPLVIASTTPVVNLTTAPATYNAAGAQQTNAHIVEDSGTLVSASPSTATITLAGSAAFTSNASYNCAVTNQTTQANPLKVAYTNGTTFVVTGPNTVTDVFSFVCVGK